MASMLIVGGGSLFLGGAGALLGWVLSRGGEKMVRPLLGEPSNYLDLKVRQAFAAKLASLGRTLEVEEGRWFVSVRGLSPSLEDESAKLIGELILVKRFLENASEYRQTRAVLEPMVADVNSLADRMSAFLPGRAKVLREEARLIVPQTIALTTLPSLQEKGAEIKCQIQDQFQPSLAMWHLTTWFTEDPEVLAAAEKWAGDMCRAWDVISKGESAAKHSDTIEQMQRLTEGFFSDPSWGKLKRYYGARARAIENALKLISDGSWTVVDRDEAKPIEVKAHPRREVGLTYAAFQVEASSVRADMQALSHYRAGDPPVERFFKHIKHLQHFWEQRVGKKLGYTETLKSIAHEIRQARWFQEGVKQTVPAEYLIINPFLEEIDPPQRLF